MKDFQPPSRRALRAVRVTMLSLLVFFPLVVTRPLLAQNVVANGEFPFNINVWNPGGLFNAQWFDTDGSPQFGSLSLSSTGTTQIDLATQCVTAPLAGSLQMGARIRNVQFVGASSVKFDFFSSTNCTGGTVGTNTPATTTAFGTFTEFFTASFPAPGSTNSTLITLSMHSSSTVPDNAGVAHFDHVYLGPAANVCTTDTTPPSVTAPGGVTVRQTLCQ